MGGNQSTNSVSKFEPPDYTQGGWKDFLAGAQQLSSQPYTPYDGMTVSPWNGTQDAAGGLIAETALNGSPDANAARASNTAVSEGQFLGNPYTTDAYAQKAIGSNADLLRSQYQQVTQPTNDAAMARAGAFGGSGAEQQRQAGQAGLEKSIGDMANQYSLANAQQGATDYRAGVGQMLGANSQGQGYQAQDLANAQAFMGVGNSQNQYEQALLNAQQQQWQNAQNYPASMLGLFQQALQAASGSGGTTIGSNTQSGQPSWVTTGAGLGAGLYGLLGH